MGWVANTNLTGWYRNGWVWKITVSVPEGMTAGGWAAPLFSFPGGGMDGGVDFFRLNPGDVTANGFDGSSFGNDAGWGYFSSHWNSYGLDPAALGDLPAGNYTVVAYAFNVDTSPPTGAAPSWQPSTDFGVWLDINGVIVGGTLEAAQGVRDGVGIYVAKIDRTTPSYQRLIYSYSTTKGLIEVGPIDDPVSSFAPSTLTGLGEFGGGDFAGRSYVTKNSFPVSPAEIFIQQHDGTHKALLIDTQDQVVPVPSRRGLLYAFPNTGGGVLDRFLAGDTPRYVDQVSFPGVFPLGDTSGHFKITYGLVDKDDATIIYGMSQLGLWKANIKTKTVTSIATFTPNFKDVYVQGEATIGSHIIGQRQNGDIVTSPLGANFGFVHTWGRDGSGMKTEAYLGAVKDFHYAPVGLALLDDDTILFGWSIYETPERTRWSDTARYPRDRVQHFYTAPLEPNYEAASFESMPDSDRLFIDGTTGNWSTMAEFGSNPDTFFVDDSVQPHNGVGRTMQSNVVFWSNNQYMYNTVRLPVLPADVVTFSVWLMPEDTGALSYGSWSELLIYNEYGNNKTFFSLGSITGLPGDDTELTPGEWTRVFVTGTVPGIFPPGVDPGTPAGFFEVDDAVRPGVPSSVFLRFEHPGPGRLWISDLSLHIDGHRDVGIQHVGQLAWSGPGDADDLHYFVAENGWPAVSSPVPILTGVPDSTGANFY